MTNRSDGARLSPLFTWRSAVASQGGPADRSLVLETKDGGFKAIIVKAGTQRLVALALSIHMSERGDSCFPGVTRIAREAALTPRAVQRAIRALQEGGWIQVQAAGGAKRTNLYTATIPADYVHDEGEPSSPSSDDGANGVRGEGEPGSPKVVTESANVETTSPRKAPDLTKIDGRNLPFDALANECGVPLANKARVAQMTAALKDIRGYFSTERADLGGEPFERALAEEVVRRASFYRQRWSDRTLTPTALAKWWHDCDGTARGGRSGDVDRV